MAPHGLLVLDKPPGVSTSYLVRKIASRVSGGDRPKAGHAGTLDPFASGVVLALIGDATRLQSLAMRMDKVYVAEVLLGVRTDTLDPDGSVIAEADPGPCRADDLREALVALTGEISQLPPRFSALKVGGRRAYELARKGEHPELSERRVHVKELELLSLRWPTLQLRVRCSAGTYVRALARDIGEALGLPAHLRGLRRMSVGPFEVGAAIAPADSGELPDEETVRAALKPPLAVVEAAGLETLQVSDAEARAFVSGRLLRQIVCAAPVGERVGVTWLTRSGGLRLLGVGEVRDRGAVAPSVVLACARADAEA